MWKKYKVTLEFNNRLCGSTPLDPEMMAAWLDARKPAVRPPGSRSQDEILAEAMGSVATQNLAEENEGIEQRTTLGFQAFKGNLMMRGGTVKAHLKDCSRIISSFSARIEGERSFAVKVINCVYVGEYWIPILKNGKILTKPDGFFDKSVHMNTPRGPRSAIKRIGYVEGATMDFTLNIMETVKGKDREGKDKGGDVVHLKDLKSLLDYGSVHGYAGERGDGEGRYTYKIQEA